MVTRLSKTGWTAIVAGLFLMSGFSLPVHGQEAIEQQECRVGDQNGTIPRTIDSNGFGHDSASCPECKKKSRFGRMFSWGSSSGSNCNDPCDDGQGGKCKKKGSCKLFGGGKANGDDPCRHGNGSCWGNGCRMCKGKGCKSCRHCSFYNAADPGYCDPRDLELYAAQGYGVPMAVPLAPVVAHTYHYGWGVPSSRVVRVGASYSRWYPAEPFTQTGGSLPGGRYPMVYQPTDTTQLGFYHVHAPRWIPANRSY